MGYPSRTVTEQSFTVPNRACFSIFATELSYWVYPRATSQLPPPAAATPVSLARLRREVRSAPLARVDAQCYPHRREALCGLLVTQRVSHLANP